PSTAPGGVLGRGTGLRPAAGPGRTTGGGHLGTSARRGAGRRTGQLFRTRRPLAPRDASPGADLGSVRNQARVVQRVRGANGRRPRPAGGGRPGVVPGRAGSRGPTGAAHRARPADGGDAPVVRTAPVVVHASACAGEPVLQ